MNGYFQLINEQGQTCVCLYPAIGTGKGPDIYELAEYLQFYGVRYNLNDLYLTYKKVKKNPVKVCLSRQKIEPVPEMVRIHSNSTDDTVMLRFYPQSNDGKPMTFEGLSAELEKKGMRDLCSDAFLKDLIEKKEYCYDYILGREEYYEEAWSCGISVTDLEASADAVMEMQDNAEDCGCIPKEEEPARQSINSMMASISSVPVTEDESAIESEAVIEAEAAIEEEAVIEAEAAIEEEAVIEAEAAIEEEAVIEAESVIEEETVIEAETVIVEPKPSSEKEAMIAALQSLIEENERFMMETYPVLSDATYRISAGEKMSDEEMSYIKELHAQYNAKKKEHKKAGSRLKKLLG